jgi:hypothetical protein
MILLKHVSKVIALVVALWVGWQLYVYFLDTTIPSVCVAGIDENGYYSGDIRCCVKADKRGEASLWLDDQSIADNVRVKASQEGQPFIIQTKALSNGKHMLKVEFFDSSFNRNNIALSREFHIDNSPLQAVLIKAGTPYRVHLLVPYHVHLNVFLKPKIQKYMNALSLLNVKSNQMNIYLPLIWKIR